MNKPSNDNVLKDREKFLGGSEIGTILGINPYKDRFSLLLEKSELKESDFVDNQYVDFGSEMEKYIRDYINQSYIDDPFIEDTVIKEEDIISLRCNYDGRNSKKTLEIKTTSKIHENVRDYKLYIVQLLYGLILDNKEEGILAVYRRNENFEIKFEADRLQLFDINIKDFQDWVKEIKVAIKKFKEDLAKIRENPMLTEEDLMPSDLTELSNKVLELENQLAAYDELVKQRDELKENLRQAMIKSGVKKWTTPNNTQITLILDGEDKEVQKFNESLFKEENESIYNKYLETKIQKGRKGSLKITLPKEK